MDPRIQIALRIVDEQKVSVHLTLVEISRTLRLSTPHLLRLFHREVGKSFPRYLRDVRMTKAAELVRAQVDDYSSATCKIFWIVTGFL